MFVCPNWYGSPHDSEGEKLSASTIALSRTQTRLARVNSEKKFSSLVSQSAVCPWGQLLQRSSCSTCINTKTQWGQPPHTAGDIRKHRVGQNEVDTALQLDVIVGKLMHHPKGRTLSFNKPGVEGDRSCKATYHPWCREHPSQYIWSHRGPLC